MTTTTVTKLNSFLEKEITLTFWTSSRIISRKIDENLILSIVNRWCRYLSNLKHLNSNTTMSINWRRRRKVIFGEVVVFVASRKTKHIFGKVWIVSSFVKKKIWRRRHYTLLCTGWRSFYGILRPQPPGYITPKSIYHSVRSWERQQQPSHRTLEPKRKREEWRRQPARSRGALLWWGLKKHTHFSDIFYPQAPKGSMVYSNQLLR